MAYPRRWRTRRYGRSRYRRRRRLRATISRPVPPMAIGYHVESPRTAVRYVSFVYHNRFDAPVYNNPTFDVVGVRCAECFDPVFASTPVSTSPSGFAALSEQWDQYCVLQARVRVTIGPCALTLPASNSIPGLYLFYVVPGFSNSHALPGDYSTAIVQSNPKTFPSKYMLLGYLGMPGARSSNTLEYVYDIGSVYGVKNVAEEEDFHRYFTGRGYSRQCTAHFRLKYQDPFTSGVSTIPSFSYTIRTTYKLLCMNPRVQFD